MKQSRLRLQDLKLPLRTHDERPAHVARAGRCTSHMHIRHMRSIWLKKFGRSRAPRTRRCENACQRAGTAVPADGSDGCLGLMGDTAEHISSMAGG